MNNEFETPESVEQSSITESPSSEQEHETSTPSESNQEQKQESDKDRNWRELREKAARAEKAERERDELVRYMQQISYEQQQYKEKQAAPLETEFDINSIDDDEVLDGKQLKKVFAHQQKIQKKIQQEMTYQQQQAYERAVEAKLQSIYPDLNKVLNYENIIKLREMDPSLARSLNVNPDIEDKALATYNAIKRYGIYQQDPYEQEKRAYENNSMKPRSSNSVSPHRSNPLAAANDFANYNFSSLSDRQKYYDTWKDKK